MTKAIIVFFAVMAGFALFTAWLVFADWVGEYFDNRGVSFVLGLGVPIALLMAIASLGV